MTQKTNQIDTFKKEMKSEYNWNCSEKNFYKKYDSLLSSMMKEKFNNGQNLVKQEFKTQFTLSNDDIHIYVNVNLQHNNKIIFENSSFHLRNKDFNDFDIHSIKYDYKESKFKIVFVRTTDTPTKNDDTIFQKEYKVMFIYFSNSDFNQMKDRLKMFKYLEKNKTITEFIFTYGFQEWKKWSDKLKTKKQEINSLNNISKNIF
jgi:hypothetical protein